MSIGIDPEIARVFTSAHMDASIRLYLHTSTSPEMDPPITVSRAWFCLFYFLLRPLLKWTLRKWTGKCELLRITYRGTDGNRRTKAIEKCLELSKAPAVRSLAFDAHVDVPKAVDVVMEIKDIKPEVHASFRGRFGTCVEQITGYKLLLEQVEKQRKIPYSDQDKEHEEKLMKIWAILEPDRVLPSRICPEWQDIGFQGHDPKTDFRGMGRLGLDNLYYFLTNHTDEARQVYSASHHPKYSFAIVGINLTALCYELLAKRHLTTHFYNAVHAKPEMRHFHALYSHIFYEFDRFYRLEAPADIMQFNIIKQKYFNVVCQRLKDPDYQFMSKFTESV